jgi:hypothetical protein
MSNARWVQQQPVHTMTAGNYTVPASPSGAILGNQQQSPGVTWFAVADDDEILANVTGDGQHWTAYCAHSSTPHQQHKHATFISEAGAKRRVEFWLSNFFTFPKASVDTAWTMAGANP